MWCEHRVSTGNANESRNTLLKIASPDSLSGSTASTLGLSSCAEESLMPFSRPFTRWLTTRRTLRTLDRIATALETQTLLLSRLVDYLAPLPPPAPDPDLLLRTRSIDHVDEQELLLAQAYADRMRSQTGHEPSDEEILQFLADEQTHALHARLDQNRGR